MTRNPWLGFSWDHQAMQVEKGQVDRQMQVEYQEVQVE